MSVGPRRGSLTLVRRTPKRLADACPQGPQGPQSYDRDRVVQTLPGPKVTGPMAGPGVVRGYLREVGEGLRPRYPTRVTVGLVSGGGGVERYQDYSGSRNIGIGSTWGEVPHHVRRTRDSHSCPGLSPTGFLGHLGTKGWTGEQTGGRGLTSVSSTLAGRPVGTLLVQGIPDESVSRPPGRVVGDGRVRRSRRGTLKRRRIRTTCLWRETKKERKKKKN